MSPAGTSGVRVYSISSIIISACLGLSDCSLLPGPELPRRVLLLLQQLGLPSLAPHQHEVVGLAHSLRVTFAAGGEPVMESHIMIDDVTESNVMIDDSLLNIKYST